MPRSDTVAFLDKNADLSKEARYVVQFAFDTAATDLVYTRSHVDAALPSGATYTTARVLNAPARSQSMDPIKARSTIGAIAIEIQDTDGSLTALINSKLAGGDGLRHKRVRLYLGYRGLSWSDYSLFQTQIVDSYSYKDGVYIIRCKDIQRTAKKRLFEPKRTFLDAEVNTAETAAFAGSTSTDGTGTITVADTSEFEMIYHGPSYEDRPSATVGYIKIDDEIIRYTGKTATTFTGCTRARLGTNAALHTTDTSADDKRTKVEEYIYLELPTVKLIVALLTGTITDDAATLPAHWNLEIDSAYINLASYTNIGTDLWVNDTIGTKDDTLGHKSVFKYIKPQPGKQFIEEQLHRAIGCTPIIYNDGSLGIKRLSPLSPKSAFVRVLNKGNIISYSEITHDAQQVYNTFVINWNYQLDKKDFTRQNIVIDSNSISIHQASDAIVMDMYGITGSAHSGKFVKQMFDFLRQRYTGPPKLLTVDLLFKENNLSIGDVVRVQLDQVRDAAEGTTTLDQSFEIQRMTTDPRSGKVTLDLFGGSVSPTAISHTGDTTALDSGMYSTTSLKASNKLDTYCASSYLVSTVLHIDSNNTFTGQATIPGATNDCIYWYDDDVYFDDGYTQSLTENVIFMAAGFITYECTFDGIGGSTGTGSQFFGNTLAGAGIEANFNVRGDQCYPYKPESPVLGQVTETPEFNIQYQGGTSFSDLMDAGFPTNLRGTEGGDGGDAIYGPLSGSPTTLATGGAGGAGGAGLAFICQGIDAAGNGVINLSGDPGIQGTPAATPNTGWLAAPGTGGGGAPGALLILLDGSSANETDVLGSLTANIGASDPIGQLGPFGVPSGNGPYHGGPVGFDETNLNSAALKVSYIQAPETIQADNPLTTSVGSIGLVETTNTPQTPAENLASVTATITPSSDTNYSHHNVYWKLSSEPDTAYEFHSVAADTTVLVAPMDGTSYDIKAVPVSIYGVESTDYTVDSITMSNTTGGVTLASGNYVQSGQTAFDTGTGFFLGNVSSVPKFSIGNSGGNKVTWDGTTLAVTGTLTATTGTIGGWTIGSTTLTSTNIGLDSSNQKIYIGGSTFQSAGFYADYSGGSGRFYAGDGADNYAEFDGTYFRIGQDALLESTSSYKSDIYYFGMPFGMMAHYVNTSGTGSVDDWGMMRMGVGTSAGSATASCRTIASGIYDDFTYDKRVTVEINIINSTANNYSFGIGDCVINNTAYKQCSIQFESDGNIYAYVASGSGGTKSSSLGAYSTSSVYTVEIIFTAGTSVIYNIDGVYKTTITTNLPSGSTTSGGLCSSNIAWVSGGSAAYMFIGLTRYWQTTA